MELFSKAIVAPTSVTTDPSAGPEITGYGCGTYEQLQYWANNFDDFAVRPYNELLTRVHNPNLTALFKLWAVFWKTGLAC